MSEDAKRNEFLGRMRPTLLAFAESQTPTWLRSKIDPADLVQQTFLEIVRGRDQLEARPDHEVLAYLRRALSNNLIDAVRKFAGTRAEVSADAFAESSSGLANWLAAPDTSPSERAVRNERFEKLASGLAQLPEAQRIAVELRYLRGLKVSEIAQMLARSEGAVALLLHRAVSTLRVELVEPQN